MEAAGQPIDQPAALGNADAPDAAGQATAEPAAEAAAGQATAAQPGADSSAAADAVAADAAPAPADAPDVASEEAQAAQPSLAEAPSPTTETVAEQPAAGEQGEAGAGDGPAHTSAAEPEMATEEARIPDAASMYAALPPIIGTKRSLETDESAANAEAAATADAAATAAGAAPGAATQQGEAASPAAPSPKRQRLSPAPGSWDTVLRLVVPQRRVGLIIGKQGATITELQKTTGARIQVTPAVPLCDERVVVLSAPEVPSAPTNGAVSALLGIHRVITTADPEPPGVPTVVKLLIGRTQAAAVPAPEAGSGMEAGATLKLLRAKQLPLTALSNDRAVEISGSPEAVGAAVAALAARLRAHPAKQRPGSTPPLLAERIAATVKGPLARGGPPPPPPPRVSHAPPAAHAARPQQYGAPAAYY